MADSDLVVAVTGPTGTFGHGLLPLMQAEPRIKRVVGVARSPFDPDEEGWSKLTYRQGDVRDPDALTAAFSGADVVVHLAFLITGTSSPATIRAVNVDGTLNAFRAAAAAGARRFVFASSVAAYGFYPDNPVGMTEQWPVRPAAHLFYAQEKAELEKLLHREAEANPALELYLLRPSLVLGPHVVGGKTVLPERFAGLGAIGGRLAELVRRLPVPLPMLSADVPMQFVHESDVGSALLACVLGDGPPGAYNIGGDGVVTGSQFMRQVGLWPIRVPTKIVQFTARQFAAAPLLPPAVRWAEAFSHPAIMDTTRAKHELGWTPHYTSFEAMQNTFGGRR